MIAVDNRDIHTPYIHPTCTPSPPPPALSAALQLVACTDARYTQKRHAPNWFMQGANLPTRPARNNLSWWVFCRGLSRVETWLLGRAVEDPGWLQQGKSTMVDGGGGGRHCGDVSVVGRPCVSQPQRHTGHSCTYRSKKTFHFANRFA